MVDVGSVLVAVKGLLHIVGGEVVLRLIVHVVDTEPLALLGGFHSRQFEQHATVLAAAERHIDVIKLAEAVRDALLC